LHNHLSSYHGRKTLRDIEMSRLDNIFEGQGDTVPLYIVTSQQRHFRP